MGDGSDAGLAWPMPETWKPCSTCKKPILHGGRWFKCSVSTCNSGRFQLAFCSVTCWDAHSPAMNHRSNVWAIEERVPASEAAPGKVVPAASMVTVGPRPVATPPRPMAESAERRIVRGPSEAREPEEVLIIASRLKDYVREQSEFNTSADVFEALSDIVRDATRDAIDRARAEGRRTVMARDFRRP